jgi:gliding motility-associated-like protein
MKKVVMVIICLFWSGSATCQFFENPSFEGTPQFSSPPPGWFSCGDYSTPDTQPINDANTWNFTKKAFDGNTYLGLITRGSIGNENDNQAEAAGTKLLIPLKKNSCYNFSMHLSTFLGAQFYFNFTTVLFNNPGRISVWAGSGCNKSKLIWTSPIISSEEWKLHNFQFSNNTDTDYEYLIIEAEYEDTTQKKYGNVLVDKIGIEKADVELGHVVICDGTEKLFNALPHIESIKWNTGSTEPSILINTHDTYWANITVGNCRLTDTLKVDIVYPLKNIPPIDTVLCLRDEWLINVKSPFASYLWNSGADSSVVLVSKASHYSVEIKNDCNSVVRDFSINYRDQCCQITYPNVFTPNGDSFNEFFELSTTSDLVTYDLQIFNRWGVSIFETSSINNFWDGTNHGKEVSAGVYFWAVYSTCIHANGIHEGTYKGTVTVLK